jgi:hypothetical protein
MTGIKHSSTDLIYRLVYWKLTSDKVWKYTRMAKKKATEIPLDNVMQVDSAAGASKKRATVTKHKSATKRTPSETGSLQSSASPAAPALTTPAPATRQAPAPAHLEVPQNAIARLAYSYWEARGYTPGFEVEDWLRAEADLRSRAITVHN